VSSARLCASCIRNIVCAHCIMCTITFTCSLRPLFMPVRTAFLWYMSTFQHSCALPVPLRATHCLIWHERRSGATRRLPIPRHPSLKGLCNGVHHRAHRPPIHAPAPYTTRVLTMADQLVRYVSRALYVQPLTGCVRVV
jgi:hypothetical protein